MIVALVAQWQSTGFVNPGLRVQIPPRAWGEITVKRTKDIMGRMRVEHIFKEEETKERIGRYGPRGPKQKGKRKGKK